MVTSMLFVLFVLLCSIAFILRNQYKNRIQFERKITVLENIITELTNKLKNQEQQVKHVEELKNSLQQSNKFLSNNIAEMNAMMFEELFDKKM